VEIGENTSMSKVEEIERAIQSLPPESLAEFRAWFTAFDAQVWDRDFDDDVRQGRLDQLADEALNAVDRGDGTPL
jgi:hypothetical protein